MRLFGFTLGPPSATFVHESLALLCCPFKDADHLFTRDNMRRVPNLRSLFVDNSRHYTSLPSLVKLAETGGLSQLRTLHVSVDSRDLLTASWYKRFIVACPKMRELRFNKPYEELVQREIEEWFEEQPQFQTLALQFGDSDDTNNGEEQDSDDDE